MKTDSAPNQNFSNSTGFRQFLAANVFLNIGGPLWGSLTNYISVMAVFIVAVGGSSFHIGLISAVSYFGLFSPQLFSAYFFENKRYKKVYFAGTQFLSGIPWLLFGIFILYWSEAGSDTILILFFSLSIISAFMIGLSNPMVFEILNKLLPDSKRGAYFGVLYAVGFGSGIFGGILSKYLLKIEYPVNYGLSFLISFFLTSTGCLIFYLLKEPEGVSGRTQNSFPEYCRKLILILKNDGYLKKFIIGRWFMTGSFMSLAFFAYYATKIKGFSLDNAGIFTSCFMAGQVFGGLTIGKISDRIGFKNMLILSQLFALSTVIFVLFAENLLIFYFLFFIAGLTMLCDTIGYVNVTFEICPGEEKSTYIALVHVLSAPFIILAPALGGFALKIISCRLYFCICGILMIFAIIYIKMNVYLPQKSKAG